MPILEKTIWDKLDDRVKEIGLKYGQIPIVLIIRQGEVQSIEIKYCEIVEQIR